MRIDFKFQFSSNITRIRIVQAYDVFVSTVREEGRIVQGMDRSSHRIVWFE